MALLSYYLRCICTDNILFYSDLESLQLKINEKSDETLECTRRMREMCAEAKVKDINVLRLLMIIPRMAMAFASVRGLASSYVVSDLQYLY